MDDMNILVLEKIERNYSKQVVCWWREAALGLSRKKEEEAERKPEVGWVGWFQTVK